MTLSNLYDWLASFSAVSGEGIQPDSISVQYQNEHNDEQFKSRRPRVNHLSLLEPP